MSQRMSRPMSAVCVDAMAVDASAQESSMPSLRPHLTVFFDLATRTPLGHHLGFEPLSIESALLALRQAIHETGWNGWCSPTGILSGAAHGAPNPQQAATELAPNGDARPKSDR